MKICNSVLLCFVVFNCGPVFCAPDLQHTVINVQPEGFPVTITDAKKINDNAPIVFFISGDGGWYKFEQAISDELALDGIPTIGFDTRIYFRYRKTPEKTAIDVSSILSYYSEEMHKQNIVFIGYSLGAELVPFIISRLPSEMQDRVKMYVLLSPASTTDFEVHLSDRLGMANTHDTYRVVEEIKKIPSIPAVCIFGSEEKTQVPSLLKGTKVKIVVIPGDHHYKFNSKLIVKTMKENNAF
jgi:type IV secretory pathway VirJ component